MDTVGAGRGQERSVRPAGAFTAVTHDLLRGEAKFREPLDFMVYMHLYTYSYGFGRQTADMSQSQLERFTAASKNTIKRSLERLVKDGWIKMVEDFECARMSRKWRVFAPEDRRGPRGGQRGENEGSATNSVQDSQEPGQTLCLSKMDPPTVSKIDPYIERIPKEKSKNSLSVRIRSARLQRYFAESMPVRKRESELQGFRELNLDFVEDDIEAAFGFLQERGLPGSGQPCHSPMAYLAKAMKEVMAEVEQVQSRSREREELCRREGEESRQRLEQEGREAQEWVARETAFNRAFSGEERQQEAIAELCRGKPFSPRSQLGRAFAIGKWWDGLTKYERMELAS